MFQLYFQTLIFVYILVFLVLFIISLVLYMEMTNFRFSGANNNIKTEKK